MVVVRVNDIGTGRPGENCVLDLSRAAMATLIGKKTNEITDVNASMITLSMILVVGESTPVGPYGAGR